MGGDEPASNGWNDMDSDELDRDAVLARLSMAGRRQSTAMVLFHANLAARLGLGATDEKVLELVSRHGALTPKELARRTGLAPASISAVLDRLEAKHFLRRQRSSDDRRSFRVVPDPEHTRAVGALFTGLMTELAALHASYSTEDLRTVLGFIEATTRIQERAARELGGPSED
ncbi:MarR family winged helix-turn-helix transcriptional regulator [Pseudonocardia kunmingensis]|uniref:DNA-binding MarR family transcriptional regulator n=1 Tax=Pseudonocardia kunmingensis TaxID=630975 RepID=A0A543E3N1_9PSEU|nr:MarR family transcriptional regulator [Pseudonocardia kunmingensis]TQM16059.1 DNA-binding MarR family transcriptional regulator [Pseudonocardia kunmingensis]